MTIPTQVQEAFEYVSKESEPTQALLRHVLVRALHDAATMRVLRTVSFASHLSFVGRVLFKSASDGSSIRLPSRQDVFVSMTLGHGFSDAEEAYTCATNLPEHLRTRVEHALMQSIDESSARSHDDPISLLAVARLLAIAYTDPEFVDHVTKGLEVEPFLETPRQSASPPHQSASPPHRVSPGENRAATRPWHPADVKRWHEYFVGKIVEIAVALPSDWPEHPSSKHSMFVRGYCLEVGINFVVLDVDLYKSQLEILQSSPVLFGLSNIVFMRIVEDNEG
ncbi:MAG TPA: hypothetical protein VL242_22860 [Sorangium sp.]|nr:hypothetical protein [Sorangium sp.]